MDDTSSIQAAINACPSGQFVQLGPGTFNISMAGSVVINNSIVLRGTGNCSATLTYSSNASAPYFGGYSNPLCQTVLTSPDGLEHVNAGRTCQGGTCSGNPLIGIISPSMSNNDDWKFSNCNKSGGPGSGNIDTSNCGGAIYGLAADAAAGQPTVQVSSTTGITAGQWLILTEASGAVFQSPFPVNCPTANIWAAQDAFKSSGSPITSRVVWDHNSNPGSCPADDGYGGTFPYISGSFACGAFSYCDRVVQEVKLVKSIGAGPCPGANCTITFDSPLTTAFRVSGGAQFMGYISGTTLTVTSMLNAGTITLNAPITDQNSIVTGSTAITSSGTGGVGTYTVSIGQTVGSAGSPIAMAASGYAAKILIPTRSVTSSIINFNTMAGVENLTVQRGTGGGNIQFIFCAYCWAKNVDSSQMAGGAIEVIASSRVQIENVFGHECWNNENAGGEYPFDYTFGASENYMVNSISWGCGKHMTARAGGAGTVVAYNYADDLYYGSGAGLQFYLIDTSLNGGHFAGSHGMLFEGNWAVNFLSDHNHGGSTYHVYFRNYANGYRTKINDPQSGQLIDDINNIPGTPGTNGVFRGGAPSAYDYWHAFVGNVIAPNPTTGWIYQSPASGSVQDQAIWNLGKDDPTGSYDIYLSGTSGSYLFRHGNYDSINNSIVDYQIGYSRNLPNSFYINSKPSFFSGASCSYPWPWVTPAGTSQLQSASGPGSCSTRSGLPAQARWQAGTPLAQP